MPSVSAETYWLTGCFVGLLDILGGPISGLDQPTMSVFVEALMTAVTVSRSAAGGGRSRAVRGGGNRGEKLAELHEQIVAGTEALVSSQGWQEMLQIVARMPQC